MLRKFKNIILLGVLLIVISSCSKYQKLLKSDDYEVKYIKAMEYYDDEDYYKALNLFDMVIPFYRGEKEAEEIAYRYAYAYYKQGDYILASYYFARFAQTYPRTDKAEECSYMKAYCKYLISPDYNLDQSSTKEALNELQLFANLYPDSERISTVNELIEELHLKLQRKYFEIAELYMQMEKYKAVITTFDVLLKDYPDTEYKEQANLKKIMAYYEFALKSVTEKQEERFKKAYNLSEDFMLIFPESEDLAKVKKVNEKIKQQLQIN